MNRASLLALLASDGWDVYLNVSMVCAVAWIATWVIARRAARRTRLRYRATTVARGLGVALVISDLFDLAVEAGAGQMVYAVISAVGAFFVGLALSLLDGDDWFSDSWKKAKRKARTLTRHGAPRKTTATSAG